jgi:tRNA nucleotidyltransferase (CCA-adding enzyme)
MPDVRPDELADRIAALPGIERLHAVAERAPVYLVGGAIRDLLLGLDPPSNLDLVVEADVWLIAAELGGEVRTHQRFETATVQLGEVEVDLARARTETYPHPGALPQVSPAGLDEDLDRRDFTINAMAVPLGRDAELVDPHGGLRDLRDGLLRVLHDVSFVDDPTRALRAARYAARLGLGLEDRTHELLGTADLATVSRERAVAELRRVAHEERRVRGFELLDEWEVFPLPSGALELIASIDGLGPPWPEVADPVNAVVAAALGQVARARDLAAAGPTSPSAAVELAHGRDATELLLARAMGAEWLDRYVGEWRQVRLEISGEDLLAEGFERGPAIGRGLKAALDAKLDGKIAGRDEELRVAREAAGAT